jgi:hypothetical protein
LRKDVDHKKDHEDSFFFPKAKESENRSLTSRKLIRDDSTKIVFKSPRERKR